MPFIQCITQTPPVLKLISSMGLLLPTQYYCVIMCVVQELDAASGEAVCHLYPVDWGSADAQRAVEKARLTLTLRGVDVDSVVQSKSPPQRR